MAPKKNRKEGDEEEEVEDPQPIQKKQKTKGQEPARYSLRTRPSKTSTKPGEIQHTFTASKSKPKTLPKYLST